MEQPLTSHATRPVMQVARDIHPLAIVGLLGIIAVSLYGTYLGGYQLAGLLLDMNS